MFYTLTFQLPQNPEYAHLCVMLSPQNYGDALELSHSWETKDYVGKQAPRYSPTLTKGSLNQTLGGERARKGTQNLLARPEPLRLYLHPCRMQCYLSTA